MLHLAGEICVLITIAGITNPLLKGMEELIRQAFLHIEVIGPHVADGHYDLVGPNGDIILPQIWDTVIEPDWSITMHMWPIPEKPKTPEPPPAPEAPADPEPAPEPPAAPEPDPEPAPETAPEPEPEPAPEPEPPAAPEVEEAVPASEEPKKIGMRSFLWLQCLRSFLSFFLFHNI